MKKFITILCFVLCAPFFVSCESTDTEIANALEGNMTRLVYSVGYLDSISVDEINSLVNGGSSYFTNSSLYNGSRIVDNMVNDPNLASLDGSSEGALAGGLENSALGSIDTLRNQNYRTRSYSSGVIDNTGEASGVQAISNSSTAYAGGVVDISLLETSASDLNDILLEISQRRGIIMLYCTDLRSGRATLTSEDKLALNEYIDIIKETTNYLNNNAGNLKSHYNNITSIAMDENSAEIINARLIRANETLKTRYAKLDTCLDSLAAITNILVTRIGATYTDLYNSSLIGGNITDDPTNEETEMEIISLDGTENYGNLTAPSENYNSIVNDSCCDNAYNNSLTNNGCCNGSIYNSLNNGYLNNDNNIYNSTNTYYSGDRVEDNNGTLASYDCPTSLNNNANSGLNSYNNCCNGYASNSGYNYSNELLTNQGVEICPSATNTCNSCANDNTIISHNYSGSSNTSINTNAALSPTANGQIRVTPSGLNSNFNSLTPSMPSINGSEVKSGLAENEVNGDNSIINNTAISLDGGLTEEEIILNGGLVKNGALTNFTTDANAVKASTLLQNLKPEGERPLSSDAKSEGKTLKHLESENEIAMEAPSEAEPIPSVPTLPTPLVPSHPDLSEPELTESEKELTPDLLPFMGESEANPLKHLAPELGLKSLNPIRYQEDNPLMLVPRKN